MKWSRASLVALGALIADPTGAVEPTSVGSDIDQITSPHTEPVSQISAPSSTIIAPTQVQPQKGEPLPQLVTRSASAPVASQLTQEARSFSASPQLSTGPRSAQSSQSISRPSEGRTTATERVGGTDRCDAASPANQHTQECTRVIETRAAEFPRRDPPSLSAEQTLLLEQQPRRTNSDITGATRRLGSTGLIDTSLETLGVASVALQATTVNERQDMPAEDVTESTASAAVLNAIFGTSSGSAPSQR